MYLFHTRIIVIIVAYLLYFKGKCFEECLQLKLIFEVPNTFRDTFEALKRANWPLKNNYSNTQVYTIIRIVI